MRVRIIKSLTTPRGEIPAGRVISMPGYLVERLKDKVEPIIDRITNGGAIEIVTSKGESLWVAMDEDSASQIPPGAIFFLGDEITQLQKAGGEQAVRVMFMFKQVFGNDSRLIDPRDLNQMRALKSKLH